MSDGTVKSKGCSESDSEQAFRAAKWNSAIIYCIFFFFFKHPCCSYCDVSKCHLWKRPMATSCCLRFLFPRPESADKSFFSRVPGRYRHSVLPRCFPFLLLKKLFTVNSCLIPFCKQRETTGSVDVQCCSVLKQTWPFSGKPVIN